MILGCAMIWSLGRVWSIVWWRPSQLSTCLHGSFLEPRYISTSRLCSHKLLVVNYESHVTSKLLKIPDSSLLVHPWTWNSGADHPCSLSFVLHCC
ncbi:hypothetical protein K438DRAFT_47873 [Mycena galopus ATCC 62051]|nr:hypothetical protein K438DRAFT_47873 [Mycena galopus ATCC 62051]